MRPPAIAIDLKPLSHQPGRLEPRYRSRHLHPLLHHLSQVVLDGIKRDRMVDHLAANPYLPRLIQRAGLDDSKYLRSTLTRLLRPFYAEGMAVLASSAAASWSPEELPHVAAGLYHLIFGYFANAPLLEVVLQEDPRSPAAIARQRQFLKTALGLLLGTGQPL